MGDKEVQGCARKCVATCVRGGGGTMHCHLLSTSLEADKAAAAILTSCFSSCYNQPRRLTQTCNLPSHG